jgi:hypothetical protein
MARATLVILALLASCASAWAQDSIQFNTGAGMILVQIRGNKITQFEQGLRSLQAALNQASDPAAGWRVHRTTEGASGGNALYVFIIDPIVPGIDYSLHGAIARVFPEREGKRLGNALAECFVAGYNKLSLTDTSRFARGGTTTPMPVAAAPASGTIARTFKYAGGLSATVETKVVESNTIWWKYAWKLSLQNTSTAAVDVAATIEYQDIDGFPVDESSAQRVTIAAGDSQSLTGFDLLGIAIAPKVKKVDLKVITAK